MRTDRAMLFVIDGSRALAKAIRAKIGARAMIQRCQVHTKRNVEDHLPDEMKRNAGRTISAAYESGNAVRAKRMLEVLERKHPSAAASLREGLEETLTVMRIDLEASLARILSTTNAIEFINGRIRRTTRNVAKWDGGTMVMRWLAVAVIEASKTFRKLRGHTGMPKLVAALRAHDAKDSGRRPPTSWSRTSRRRALRLRPVCPPLPLRSRWSRFLPRGARRRGASRSAKSTKHSSGLGCTGCLRRATHGERAWCRARRNRRQDAARHPRKEEHEFRGRGESRARGRRRLAHRAARAGAVRAAWDGRGGARRDRSGCADVDAPRNGCGVAAGPEHPLHRALGPTPSRRALRAASRVDRATLLRRAFDVDVTRCTGCASRMTVAVVTAPASIDRLLAALRSARDPPVAA